MLSATLGVALIVAQSVVGGSEPRSAAGSCGDGCGVERTALFNQIERLQHAPRWRERDNAAHALRRFDWRCHPEAAEVLVTALLTDCHEEVREEAAQSLTKMAPCLPTVHMALTRAAAADPDGATRRWAKRGLRALGRNRCAGACTVCAPLAVAVPGQVVGELPIVQGAPEKVLPPVDSRVEPAPAGPAPEPAVPKLEEPRLEPATGARERPLRAGLSRLGARLPLLRR